MPLWFWATIAVLMGALEFKKNHLNFLFFSVSALIIALFKISDLNDVRLEIAIFFAGGFGGIVLLRKKLQSSISKVKR